MKFHPFKLLAAGLSLVALGVGLVTFTHHQSSVQAASTSYDRSDTAQNAPIFGMIINPSDANAQHELTEGSGVGVASTSTYGATRYTMSGNSESHARYVWSNQTMNLNKSKQMSFWIYMTPAEIDEGMAFFLQSTDTDKVYNNPDGGSDTSSFGGRALGVWGDPSTNKAKPWDNALPESLAVEFDNYVSTDFYDKGFAAATGNSPAHIAAGYPSSKSTYPIYDNGTGTVYYSADYHDNPYGLYTGTYSWNSDSRAGSGDLGAVGTPDMTGRWVHVSFDYTPGKLSYTWDDEDPDGTTKSGQSGSVAVDSSKIGSTSVRYGWSSAAHSDSNILVLATDSDMIDATASDGKLFDATKQARDGNGDITDGSTVTSDDQLAYTYQVKLNGGSRSNLADVHLKTVLPSGFIPSSVTIDGNDKTVTTDDFTIKGDTLTFNNGKDPIFSTMNTGQTSTITINGKAKTVTDPNGEKQSKTTGRVVNNGIDQAITASPSYTIMPGIFTEVTGSGVNTSEVGEPDLSTAHVMAGDTIAYKFDLEYKATSMLDWDGPINVRFKVPKQLNAVQSIVATRNGVDTKLNIDHNDLDAGEDDTVGDDWRVVTTTLPAGFKKSIGEKVTFVLKMSVAPSNGNKPLSANTATATFDTTQHTDHNNPAVTGFTIYPKDSAASGQMSLKADQTVINADQVGDAYEGENFVNVSGSYQDTDVSNDNQVTMSASVTHQDGSTTNSRHVQLSNGNTKAFKLTFDKPAMKANGNGAKWVAGTATLGLKLDSESDDALLKLGRNKVTVTAIDEAGHWSQITYTIYVGLFKFTTATAEVNFPTTSLTGQNQNVKPDNKMQLIMNNSRDETSWQVMAKEETPIVAGKKQPVDLMYGAQSLVDGVKIADDQTAATPDKDGNITLIGDDDQPTLNVDVNGGAVHGNYSTTVDWTLVNSITQ